jgi:hypothetical protein
LVGGTSGVCKPREANDGTYMETSGPAVLSSSGGSQDIDLNGGFLLNRCDGDGGIMISLRVKKGDDPATTHTFDKAAITIGRGESIDVALPDTLGMGLHAMIMVEPDGETTVVNMGTPEGTYLNGKLIGKATLRKGDEIRIGDMICGMPVGVQMVLQSGDPDAPRRIEPPSRWRRFLNALGWYSSRGMAVFFMTFIAAVAAILAGFLLYFGYLWIGASPLSFVVVLAALAALVLVILTFSRRCRACKRWFALKVVRREHEHRTGMAMVRDIRGQTVSATTNEVILINTLQCRYCGNCVTRRW